MLQYGDITRDPAKLPEASLAALLARGFAHFLGNEQASKVVSRIRSEIAGENGKATDVSKEQVQAFRAENPDKVNAWANEIVAEALKSLDDGSIGTRAAAGPRVDPITGAMNSLARAEVVTILKANGLKTPKGEETIAFGDATRTMAQMIERRLASHGERLRKEAERQVADAARRKAKTEAEVKGKGTASAEALGL